MDVLKHFKDYQFEKNGKLIDLTRLTTDTLEYNIPHEHNEGMNGYQMMLNYNRPHGELFIEFSTAEVSIDQINNLARTISAIEHAEITRLSLPENLNPFGNSSEKEIGELLYFTRFFLSLASRTCLIYDTPTEIIEELQNEVQSIMRGDRPDSDSIADCLKEAKESLNRVSNDMGSTITKLEDLSESPLLPRYDMRDDFTDELVTKLRIIEENADDMISRIGQELDVYAEQMKRAQQELEDAENDLIHEIEQLSN